MSKKTKVIKLTTTNNSYKILVEYDPTTLSVAIKIRKGNDIYKQLVLSLHSLTGLQRIISEEDDVQSLMVLTGLSVLKTYLEEHRPGLYTRLILSGTLYEHLAEIDTCCSDRMDRMIHQMAESEGVNEKLKACDQLGWISRMNSIRHRVEEIILDELVFD